MKRSSLAVVLGISATLLGGCGLQRSFYFSAPAARVELPPPPGMNTESYDRIDENPFLEAAGNPLSTFSVDVDTASYSNVRRFLSMNQLPPKDAVRLEELINYFPYSYDAPQGEHPIAACVETASAPWAPAHRLVRIGIKARELPAGKRPPSNLVFLLDTSGSMDEPNKLPLVISSLKLLVEQLGPDDHVAIVAYAGSSGLVLDSTPCSEKAKILHALDKLHAGGSTNGGSGLTLAYKVAAANRREGGNNRVILATDGDFNVGITNQGDLTRLIEEKAKSDVFLTVLGFGMGNYKDSTLEKLADLGNGGYGYVDTLREAKKLMVEQIGATLVTVAKDVKVQVEFNPLQVQSYRLLGYENRILRKEDFNDDKKDAGDMGAGSTVTALYEVVPAGVAAPETRGVDALKYGAPGAATKVAQTGEMLTVKLRYKEPTAGTSRMFDLPVKDSANSFAQASTDFQFSAAVAEFGMMLRDSPNRGDASWPHVRATAAANLGLDAGGWRKEFLDLVDSARLIAPEKKTAAR